MLTYTPSVKQFEFFTWSKLILKYKLNHRFQTSYMSTWPPEFQCVHKKQYNKMYNAETMKPKLNKNLGSPWTVQGEKASGKHQIP